MNQARAQGLGVVCLETGYQKFDKIEILNGPKVNIDGYTCTFLHFAVVIPFLLSPNENATEITYHVLESEAIHVENDTGSLDRLVNNDTRCLHDIHGQELNDFSGLIFLVMEVDVDEAKQTASE